VERSIDPDGALEGVAFGDGDGEAAVEGLALDGLALDVVGELAATGELEPCAMEGEGFPHAPSNNSADIGAQSPTSFLTVMFEGRDLRTTHPYDVFD
jgi:hypothetical protein